MWPPKQTRNISAGLIAFILVCAGVYAAWSHAYPSGTWRYKLTVEIETPEGIKTGRAVREVSFYTLPRTLPEASVIEYSIKGEAVVIDLGARGQVFALLRTYKHGVDGYYYIVYDAFPRKDLNVYERAKYYKNLQAGTTLLPDQYPMFVYFRDTQDPKTVENLIEYEVCADQKGIPRNTLCLKNDRFAEAFGEGVQLKSVTIEMTREPVTRFKIDTILPWLNKVKGYIDGKFAGGGPELSNILDKGDFQRKGTR